jgi:bacillithiol biosynthesis cysteine-adding enzyme BshC
VADVDLRFDMERRRRMASAIRATSPGAAARLEEIVAGNGLFVTTGQQPGLFTGPLYTIHKILCAVQLARSLEAALERPVAPLFWVASDDHDWEEANHVQLLDRHNTLRRVMLGSSASAPPLSMRRRLLGPEIEPALEEFVQYLPTTEFAGELLQLLREFYRPDRTVAEAFSDTLARLFAPFDLLMVDGGQPLVKELAAEQLERELVDAAEHEALFAGQTRRLEQAGYRGQVPVLPSATNVFYEDDEGRDRLFREGDHFVLRQSGRRFERHELLARLRAEPVRFSANVVLRPIIESAVFPTISYVGGPGEVSYFAQYGELFRAHGIGMPVVFPRFSVLLIEAKVRKVLDRFGLEPASFRVPFHELTTRIMRDEVPDEVRDALAALRCTIEDGYKRLEAAALRIDPMLTGPLQTGRNASVVRLAEVEKRIVRHLKLQSGIELDQLAKASANLFPSGQPQERLLNIFQYLVRYGQELLPALAGGMRVSFR